VIWSGATRQRSVEDLGLCLRAPPFPRGARRRDDRRLDRDEVSAVVPADPQVVFRLVSDVVRTPQRSPEVIRRDWLDGATQPAVGPGSPPETSAAGSGGPTGR
jgi:hypothetical protein